MTEAQPNGLTTSGPLPGPEVCSMIRSESDTVFLGFSRGKDSIAAWLKLREAGFKVIPYFMYFIPGLDFQEKSVQYYEDYFGTHIYRLPHPYFYRMLTSLDGQPPIRKKIIEAAKVPNPSFDEIVGYLADDLGYSQDSRPFNAQGVRAADSPLRRSSVNQHGPINRNRRTFWPIWDMKKAELIEVLRAAGVKLPVDYRMFGRSFDGLDLRFAEPLRYYLPADYEIVKKWMPFVDADIARRDFSKVRG